MPRHKRTYIDANLLISAFCGKGEVGQRAMEVLDDPERSLIVSDAVWLEVMPKAQFQRRTEEIEFYQAVFDQAEQVRWASATLYHAHDLATANGIAAMDAIHVAIALDARAEEFVTAEKPTKPMFRVQNISMRSIR